MAQKKDEKQSEWESREDMMPEDECKLQTKEKGFDETQSQRCEQSGSTGTAKGHERKAMHQQLETLKDVNHMDENSDLLSEEEPAES
ncbi:MAG TPA: hypothetical protein PKZ32_01485 [Candidatus Melainabacteria bacterium]|nr:hypothetical protein [Candidatus Melainabacteria bacterium]